MKMKMEWIGLNGRRTAGLLFAVCAFLLLSIPSDRYRIDVVSLDAADSLQYHVLAVNLLEGRGYQSRVLGPLDSYGESARALLLRPFQTPLEESFKLAMHRGPGYPLLLAAIYSIHGPRPDVAIRYQAILAGLTGALLVLIAFQLWGPSWSVAGVAAAFLLRHQDEMTYAVSSLLSECLAAFILTLAAALAIWAKRGGAPRELAMGLLMAAAVLTRQALLMTALLYGFFLLFPFRIAWKRAVAYALPCFIAMTAWSAYISSRSGETVVMASTGMTNFLNGLDPVATAEANGQEVPALDVASLEKYWGGVPVAESPRLRSEIGRRLPSRLGEVASLMRAKLKIALFWMPRSLVWCILVGTALASTISLSRSTRRSTTADSVLFVMSAPFSSRSAATAAAGAVGFAGMAFALGYSHPALPMLCLVVCCAAVAAGIAASMRRSPVSGSTPLWLSSWLFGYLGMTLLTIGVRRFIRPYLPLLDLLAVVSIPLFIAFISSALGLSARLSRRLVRFRW